MAEVKLKKKKSLPLSDMLVIHNLITTDVAIAPDRGLELIGDGRCGD